MMSGPRWRPSRRAFALTEICRISESQIDNDPLVAYDLRLHRGGDGRFLPCHARQLHSARLSAARSSAAQRRESSELGVTVVELW